jgi:hypothetical protein
MEHTLDNLTKNYAAKNPFRATSSEPGHVIFIGKHSGSRSRAYSDVISGARYVGFCKSSIQNVYHEDIRTEEGISHKHGCYVYRLLRGLSLCGLNTEKSFATLLRKCAAGNNHPMCDYKITDGPRPPNRVSVSPICTNRVVLTASSNRISQTWRLRWPQVCDCRTSM